MIYGNEECGLGPQAKFPKSRIELQMHILCLSVTFPIGV